MKGVCPNKFIRERGKFSKHHYVHVNLGNVGAEIPGWWPAPGSLLRFGWGLVRATSVENLAGAWYGLGAGWWPAPGSLLQFGWGLVRAGGPHQVSVENLAGAWYGLGAGWWPAPGSLLQFGWAWCGLVARTRSLSKVWLGLGMGLVRAGGPRSLSKIWLGLVMGLVRALKPNFSYRDNRCAE